MRYKLCFSNRENQEFVCVCLRENLGKKSERIALENALGPQIFFFLGGNLGVGGHLY